MAKQRITNKKRTKKVALAKITRPHLSETYPHKRLFQQLDEARNARLVWVSGPAAS